MGWEEPQDANDVGLVNKLEGSGGKMVQGVSFNSFTSNPDTGILLMGPFLPLPLSCCSKASES